ncbi:MAG TPA: alpha-amylase family glycosyl hydrolase [Verrucomicrobiae bacterium]|nr:alpha-amylase family glycosyl hydrolase [Verrucomicrobiae bacterium]
MIKFHSVLRMIGLCLGLGLLAVLFVPTARAEGQDFSSQPAQSSPAWLRDGVICEIFPRDFSPAGNLNGVTAKLDQLHHLGVTILWIMPIHPIGEKFRKGEYGSPYSVKDFYAIDPSYGTLDDFKRLVAESHQRGMKVIMDLVADHTAWDSVMMKHPEYYKRDASGKILPPVPEWTDVAGLNYANPQLRDYMIKMMEYWVQTCGIDGYRCDVASMVPADFWMEARARIGKIKPDFMWLAEASEPALMTQAFNLDYDWPLMASLNKVIMDSAPASDLERTWVESRQQFPKGTLHMRVSDDHDESRAVARFGINGALAASALMFTLDGVPLLYNGMEVGDATESGDPALFNKLTIFWHPKGRPPLREIYRGLINLREHYASCFCNNRVTWLSNSDANDVVTFMRTDGTNEFIVAINFSNRPVAGQVALENGGGFKLVPISGLVDPPAGELPQFRLNGFEWQIFHRVVSK